MYVGYGTDRYYIPASPTGGGIIIQCENDKRSIVNAGVIIT